MRNIHSLSEFSFNDDEDNVLITYENRNNLQMAKCVYNTRERRNKRLINGISTLKELSSKEHIIPLGLYKVCRKKLLLKYYNEEIYNMSSDKYIERGYKKFKKIDNHKRNLKNKIKHDYIIRRTIK